MNEAVTITGAANLSSLSVAVDGASGGMRLDAWLARALDDLSRTRIKQLIKDGHVAGPDGGAATDPSLAVQPGQHFTVAVPPPVPAEPAAQSIPLDVVWEDRDLVIVDKPAGLVVHPGPGSPDGTLVNALLAHCGDSLSGIGGVERPGIVHRLDKDTSGLIVVAKSDRAHRELSAQFAVHSIDRVYTAVAWGTPRPLVGEIEGDIGRHPVHRTKMAVVSDGGKPARTYYRVTARFADAVSLLTCRLATGRTHQIRVHLAHRGHPIVGDRLYGRTRSLPGELSDSAAGRALRDFPRQALHASVLGFEHPVTGERMKFKSELPGDFQELVSELERLQSPRARPTADESD